MNHTEESPHTERDAWSDVGRAAEDFARRIARDATRFADRLSEHTSEFANDVSREWRRARHRRHRHGHLHGRTARADVQRVFEDIRGLVADVLDGIDDLISTVFQPASPEGEGSWEKVVSNRDVACSACARPVTVGEEAYVCHVEGGVRYRCQSCGTDAQAQA